MLTRRHIRVKVMQSLYALTHSKDDSLEKQQKFLKVSIENMYSLYLLMLSLLIEVHKLAETRAEMASKKYLEEKEGQYPDPEKFVKNRVLVQLANNKDLKDAFKKKGLNDWDLNGEYIKILYKEMIASEAYARYMMVSEDSFKHDRDFVVQLYKELIAPNDKIYDFLEDDRLTWVDDIPIVNTFLVKHLGKAKETSAASYYLPKLLKDQEDLVYAEKLLSKTLLKWEELSTEIQGKTPNWDRDRIADMDAILLRMAIAELLYFPSIPERVTINEYLEIAKEYSTPKSSIFINGVLDKLTKEYKENGRLKKMGRGLL